MERALVWLVNRFRPYRGWLPLMLLVGALLPLPAAITQAANRWGASPALTALAPTGTLLIVLTLLAAVSALALARTRVSERGALALGLGVGGLLVLVYVGQLVPPLSLIWSELRTLIDWVGLLQEGILGWPLPLSAVLGYLPTRLNHLGLQLWWDVQSLAGGGSPQSSQAYRLAVTWIVWILGFVASWQIYRRRSPFVGLLPTGLALTLVTFFHPTLSYYVLGFLFCMLWLLAISRLWSRKDRWDQTGTDYPEDLGAEQVISAAPWVFAFLLLASFFPVEGFYKISGTFWARYESVFGPLDQGHGESLGAGLPRSHLLGGSRELAETVVFWVETNDPPPLSTGSEVEADLLLQKTPRRYWRGETLDIYTGQGWQSSPLQASAVSANRPLQEHSAPADPDAYELRQRFELAAEARPDLYGANAPLRVDRPVQAWWRAPGDLARLTGDVSRYTIFSQPPAPTVEEMRQASHMVPPDLAERYLALPDGVPQRVLDLAQEVAGDAPTRYDQARNIETFLRTYTYTLDLPAPPNDRDLVDYFLFELQEGYCDYYASAMVVMARGVGVPARFVTGYAQGEYDHEAGRWIVTEENGHSWVEVYFEGIGWVEFEPTAGLPGLARAGDSHSDRPEVPPLPPRGASWLRITPWVYVIAVAAAVLLAAAVLALRFQLSWRKRESGPAGVVRDRYARLIRWGGYLRHPLQGGLTPSEYTHQLSASLRAEADSSRWRKVRQAGAEVGPDMKQLTESFVRAQYGSKPLGEREGIQAHTAWIRLRRRLWWLRLGQR